MVAVALAKLPNTLISPMTAPFCVMVCTTRGTPSLQSFQKLEILH